MRDSSGQFDTLLGLGQTTAHHKKKRRTLWSFCVFEIAMQTTSIFSATTPTNNVQVHFV